ncbi:MAG: M3 family metallopeptidase [Steroidobacteraceae bacterium]|nr:M3 family metallopeptidase [Steroidobacteraceae bacterium]
MKAYLRWITAGALTIAGAMTLASETASKPVVPPIAGPFATAELSFLEFLDAAAAISFIESGATSRFEGRDLGDWGRTAAERRKQLDADLARVGTDALDTDDARALAAMRTTLASFDTGNATGASPAPACADARRQDLGLETLRAALTDCFVVHGNQIRFEDAVIDRGTALQLLHVIEEPARRKALFDVFAPLWAALDGGGATDSPYRRMIALAAADAARRGSEIDAAARAIGVDAAVIERWLVAVLEAWRAASPPELVEPWDYRYVNSAATRQLEAKIPAESLLPVNERFYLDLGASMSALGVVFDLEPRADKSPLAYTDFLLRGRLRDGAWQRPVARVVGTYPTGGLFSLNELVHEVGHAVHVSAIHTRPAYMDWPDTLFTEAFADVPSWSIHEPAWQRRYLGTEAPEAASLRALFGNVMLDVAWSLFEIRMLREPRADPNAVWTDLTSRYLRIVPHPELPWWALRVQLVSDPGYMVNYGLGALLTAEMRARTRDALGAFDAGNPAWYGWLSERLLRYGSGRDTQSLMTELLGRPVSPAALLRQVERCRVAD